MSPPLATQASEARPTYQGVEEALVAAGVPFRLTEFDSVV